MSNTTWRLSGGIGVDDPQPDDQKMTQGLGFPLRPVDGVPPQDSGELFEFIPIAEGDFMQWMGPYQTGLIYPTGSVVRDGDWLMIANKATFQKPAPVPDGNPTWSLGDTPAFVTKSNESVVYSGHLITFTEPGWVKGLRSWVTELTVDTNYRVVITDVTDLNTLSTVIIDDPLLDLDAWRIIALVDALVSAGTEWLIYVDALNSGADTLVTGGWQYGGPQNGTVPVAQQWNHQVNQTAVRISNTDLDAADRKTELLGMTVGTNIVFAGTLDPTTSYTYRVIGAPIDLTGAVEFPVELVSTGPGGAPAIGDPTTMTATVPVAQATEYAEVAGSVPTPAWATMVGFLQFDGVDQVGDANTYGVDINFEPAIISPDWDLMSFGG